MGRSRPVSKKCVAEVWSTSVCVIDRITASRSARAASIGRCSQICRPGTAVGMGLNSPRNSAGASGLGSQVSCWAGPPHMNRTMHALALPLAAREAERA